MFSFFRLYVTLQKHSSYLYNIQYKCTNIITDDDVHWFDTGTMGKGKADSDHFKIMSQHGMPVNGKLQKASQ